MMLLLLGNVSDDRTNARLADRKNAIAPLPGERTVTVIYAL